jgi:hypothetical protein
MFESSLSRFVARSYAQSLVKYKYKDSILIKFQNSSLLPPDQGQADTH